MAGNSDNFEKLFLFEFLVNDVRVFNSKLDLDKTIIKILGPVAVRFQFLNYPPIEVCEDSFTQSTRPLMEEKSTLLKSGKSCMFSLSAVKSKQMATQSNFDVNIAVYKYKLQRLVIGRKPEKPEDVYIGKTKLNLDDVFKDLLRASKDQLKGDDLDKKAHTRAASNKLVDGNGNTVGKITFFVRISCFGFMIVTGFKLPEEEKIDYKYKHFFENKSQDNFPPKEGSNMQNTDICSPCFDPELKQQQSPQNRPDDASKKKKKKKKKKDIDEKKSRTSSSSATQINSQCCCPCRRAQNQMAVSQPQPKPQLMVCQFCPGAQQNSGPAMGQLCCRLQSCQPQPCQTQNAPTCPFGFRA